MTKKHDHEENASEDVREDIDFEPEDEMGDIGAAKAKLKKLRDELEKTRKERQEYLDGWQRCKADSVNARQEMMRQTERAGSRAVENFVLELIPALDGFDMAAGSPAWETVSAEWRGGIDQIRNQMLDVLAQSGIARYGKMGEMFDPMLHEAIQETDELPGESGSIVRILRYGYKTKSGTILRPAQVVLKSSR